MIRVLVVDDSAVARNLLCGVLDDDAEIEVVGVARDGREAVELVAKLRPDVITMDVQMPHMDGYRATEEIMMAHPTPIVIVSGSTSDADVEKSMTSLKAGALTVIGKPASPTAPSFDASVKRLIDTVKSMSTVKVIRRSRRNRDAPTAGAADVLEPKIRKEAVRSEAPEIAAIAASTGGPQTLQRILSGLPTGFPIPVLVVQHISPGFADGFSSWLDRSVPPAVKIADDGEKLKAGTVYVAPQNRHLSIKRRHVVETHEGPPVGGFRPSGSVLFESVAKTYAKTAIAVILTGMGQDGLDGLRAVKQAGGRVLAQNEESCIVYGMPKAAVDAGLADEILSPEGVAQYLNLAVADVT